MKYYNNTSDFYRSKEWINFINILKLKRVDPDGKIRCEHCGKPMYGPITGHHKIVLNNTNVNDPKISLNEENIMLVHHKCHDEIHSRMGQGTRHTYLVYGPSTMKSLRFVNENASVGDTICHVPSIRKMCTNGDSQRTNDLVFKIRNLILDSIKYRSTKSQNCWIIGMFSYSGERERYCREYGAEEILIESTFEEALREEGEENQLYIKEWFELNEK